MSTTIFRKSVSILILFALVFALILSPASALSAAAAENAHSAPIQNLTINGTPIGEYTIVRPSYEKEKELRPYIDETFEDAAWGAIQMNLGEALGEEFQKLMKEFTGCDLSIVEDCPENAESPDKVIWFVFNRDLEGSEYRITVDGSLVTIEGGLETALWYGMYDFLESYLGVRFIRQDMVYVPSSSGINITDGSYSEKEVFEFRDISSYYSSNETISNNIARKLNSGTSEKYRMNNTKYGSTVGTTWYNAHSFEYQIPAGIQGSTWDTQPCLSKEETYEYVRDSVMKLIEERLDAGFIIGETISIITVAWNDNRNYCACEDCIAARTGDQNLSDQYINFVNRVADDVAVKYPGMKVLALAYDETRTPPTTAVPRDNVVVMYCTAGCSNHSLGEADQCSEQGVPYPHGLSTRRVDKANLEGWLAISKSVQVWEYVDAFGSFIGEAPFYSYIKDEIRWLADAGVDGVYCEGRSDSATQYCFEGLRDYLLTNLMWDPYMSDEEYEALAREYMEIYYGKEAAPYIFEYMLMWDEAGNRNGCWLNNYLGIKASLDLDYYGDNYEKMTQLFDSAETVSSGEELTRIQKLRCSMEFLCLSGIYHDEYTNGTQEEKDWYISRSEALYDSLISFGMTSMDDYCRLSGDFESDSIYTSYEASEEGTVLDYCPLAWYKNRDGFLDVDPFYCTVQFHSNGGSEVASQRVTNFFCGQPEETTRKGYIFQGWYSDPELNGEPHVFGYNQTIEGRIGQGDCDENGVFHLYAKWEEDPDYVPDDSSSGSSSESGDNSSSGTGGDSSGETGSSSEADDSTAVGANKPNVNTGAANGSAALNLTAVLLGGICLTMLKKKGQSDR